MSPVVHGYYQQDVFLDSESALFPFDSCRTNKIFNAYVINDNPIPQINIHLWYMPGGMSFRISLKKYLACVKFRTFLSNNKRTYGGHFSDLRVTQVHNSRVKPDQEDPKTIEEFLNMYGDTSRLSPIMEFRSSMNLIPGICDFCGFPFNIETLDNGTFSCTIYTEDTHPLVTVGFYAKGSIKKGLDKEKLINALLSASPKFRQYYESVKNNRKNSIGMNCKSDLKSAIPSEDYSTGYQVGDGDSLPHIPVTMSSVDKSLKTIEDFRTSVKESMPEPTPTPATSESTETQSDSGNRTDSITEPTTDQIIAAASRKSYSELTELVNALVQLHDKRRAMRDANLATIKRLEEEASHIPKLVALINDRETRMRIGSELFAAARRALVSVGG